MIQPLTKQQQLDLESRGVSRRNFGRIAAMLSGAAMFTEAGLAQLSRVEGKIPDDAVKIDANENPLGPCKEAADAIHSIVSQGGRYRFDLPVDLETLLAEQEGLKQGYAKVFPGSSAPLNQAAVAFTSPSKAFVCGDPGYESGQNTARAAGSPVIGVPLTATYAHDVRAMVAKAPNAGLFYICNPNNPSGTLTPKEDIEWLVENKPKGSIVMIDEAYTHISSAPFSSYLVAKDKDVVILRTFSKIYGMAGLRAGAVLARPDLQTHLGKYSYQGGMMPITGMVAAIASLKASYVVPERRKKIGDVRNDLQAFLDKHNFKYVPSTSNCIMIEVGRPGEEVRTAMREREKVYIGRVWPSWPTKVRVTIGTQDEMNKFKTAFLKVMA